MNKSDSVKIIGGPFEGQEGKIYEWNAGTGAKGRYADVHLDERKRPIGVYHHNIQLLDDEADYRNDLE